MENLISLNFEKEEIKQVLKLRREIFLLSAKTPDYIFQFCIRFQTNHNELLKEFEQKVNSDKKIKKFLSRNEIIWRNKMFQNNIDHSNIYNCFFNSDEIYENNALKLMSSTGYMFLEFLYLTINYVDDNIPVKKHRELDESEKKLIKFLLYRGAEFDYIEKYKISPRILKSRLKNICDNYKCRCINDVLNLVLIEKYFKQENDKIMDILSKYRMN